MDEVTETLPAIDEEPETWGPELCDDDFEATPEEIELGNRLGQVIDVDDDEDGGYA